MSLPRDLDEVREAVARTGAALLIADPLTSRLAATLDTYKDAEVRQAREPLARLANEVRLAVIGIMHHNKGGSGDPLIAVMASAAFTAVARSVHPVVQNPEDEGVRVFGTVKTTSARPPCRRCRSGSSPSRCPPMTGWPRRGESSGARRSRRASGT